MILINQLKATRFGIVCYLYVVFKIIIINVSKATCQHLAMYMCITNSILLSSYHFVDRVLLALAFPSCFQYHTCLTQHFSLKTGTAKGQG